MDKRQNNQFWKQRSKHGRDTLFADSTLLWDAACEYFTWCDENPFQEQDFVGKDVTEIHRDKMRPYTMTGLCLYIGCNEAYFRQFDCKDKPEFKKVIDEIEKTVYDQKFSGAAAGFFNANIIARDLGLKDRTDTTSGDEPLKQVNISIDGKEIDLGK